MSGASQMDGDGSPATQPTAGGEAPARSGWRLVFVPRKARPAISLCVAGVAFLSIVAGVVGGSDASGSGGRLRSGVAAAHVTPPLSTASTAPVPAVVGPPTVTVVRRVTTPTATETPAPVLGESESARPAAPTDADPLTQPTPAPAVAIADPPPGTRDKRLWPFSADSIWNMPIGSGAVYVQAGIVPASTLSVDEEYLVFPSPSDPWRPFYTNGVWGRGRCETTTFQYNIRLPDSFQVPDANGGNTPNNVAAILADDGRTLKQMNPVSRCTAGGPLTAGWMAPDQDIYGPGILGAHGGSGLSSIGGSIRLGELTGPDPIRHALKVNLWGRRWLSPTDGGHRWPAVTADAFFNDPQNPQSYGGTLPQLRMGALLALPPDIDVDAMGLVTPAARKLAWTLQNYGAYVVDDTNWNSHALDVQAGVPEEFQAAFGYSMEASSGPWYDDMMRIFGLLAVVDNNGPSSIGGGGTPRQPLAPPIGN